MWAHLTAGNGLTSNALAVKASSQAFVTTVGGAPTSLEGLDALGGVVPVPDLLDYNAPGTYAYWATPALSSAMNVAGSPVLKVKVTAPTASGTGITPAGQLVLFAKVYDVGTDGKAALINNLVAPVRVADAAKPFTVTLPAIVHRFAAGHRVEIMLAGGNVNYRGGLVPTPVIVTTGGTGQSLVLPTVAG